MWKIAIVFFAIFAEFVQLTVLANAICLMKHKVTNPNVGAAAKNFRIAIAQFVADVVNVRRIIVAFVNG